MLLYIAYCIAYCIAYSFRLESLWPIHSACIAYCIAYCPDSALAFKTFASLHRIFRLGDRLFNTAIFKKIKN